MLLIFTLFTLTFAKHVHLPSKALQNPDLFQGDIIGIEDNDVRNAVTNLSLRWKGWIVPYTIDRSLGNIRHLITIAMKHINNAIGGCITFKQRQYEPDYILFIKGIGCYSDIGRVRGEQHLSLGEGCEYVGTVVHEIVHALGFYHEQSRSDRDNYLIIHWENIEEGMLSLTDIVVYYDGFDLESIMLYGNDDFSKDGKSLTMEAKSGIKLSSDKESLFPSDVFRIKMLYECA
ncbi:zinc metalloproteinase nas-6-like [Centruroides vittatus]|uniref:zinc metalloproteinase nas-6-like n=1 Tax=Centruroides vittatus TaxID=120091 RepID=UPI00350EDF9A